MEHSESESQKKSPLSREEAEIWKLLLTDENEVTAVHYNLLLVIRRSTDKHLHEGKADFEGKVEVVFDYYKKDLDKLNIIQHVKESPFS
jgi:hypothetical protein